MQPVGMVCTCSATRRSTRHHASSGESCTRRVQLTENSARSKSRLAAQKALARTPATRCTALLPLARSL